MVRRTCARPAFRRRACRRDCEHMISSPRGLIWTDIASDCARRPHLHAEDVLRPGVPRAGACALGHLLLYVCGFHLLRHLSLLCAAQAPKVRFQTRINMSCVAADGSVSISSVPALAVCASLLVSAFQGAVLSRGVHAAKSLCGNAGGPPPLPHAWTLVAREDHGDNTDRLAQGDAAVAQPQTATAARGHQVLGLMPARLESSRLNWVARRSVARVF